MSNEAPALEQVIEFEVAATVQCHEPCVPECTREHPWEKK
jgi:hypothetical protein